MLVLVLVVGGGGAKGRMEDATSAAKTQASFPLAAVLPGMQPNLKACSNGGAAQHSTHLKVRGLNFA